MRAVFETRGGQQDDIHLDEESFEGLFLEYGDLSLEEVLQDQEIVYQSLQTNGGSVRDKVSSSTNSNLNHEQSGSGRQVQQKEGESSQAGNVKSQLESDEDLARALQELESDLDSSSLSETTVTEAEITDVPSSSVNREVNTAETSAWAVRQDNNIDPDNMTYEELQSLGEAIGTKSRGLSEELISYLPSFKYKTGFFSKKDKHEECVICYMAYKNRDMLTTLPCQHQYHSKCVTRWLKLNKTCPVCTEEVFGS